MLRKIVIPTTENYNITIPKEYINREVEILVLPFVFPAKDNTNNDTEDILELTKGILSSNKIDPQQWQREIRDEYER